MLAGTAAAASLLSEMKVPLGLVSSSQIRALVDCLFFFFFFSVLVAAGRNLAVC